MLFFLPQLDSALLLQYHSFFFKTLSLLNQKLFNLLSEQCVQRITSLDIKMYAFPILKYHWAESLQFEKTPHSERHWSFSLCVQKCQN